VIGSGYCGQNSIRQRDFIDLVRRWFYTGLRPTKSLLLGDRAATAIDLPRAHFDDSAPTLTTH
jgi:hypothetical protein